MNQLTYDEKSFLMFHINKLYRKKFNILPRIMLSNFGLILSIQQLNVHLSIFVSKKNNLFLIKYQKSFGIGNDQFVEDYVFDDINDVYLFIKDAINMISPPTIYH